MGNAAVPTGAAARFFTASKVIAAKSGASSRFRQLSKAVLRGCVERYTADGMKEIDRLGGSEQPCTWQHRLDTLFCTTCSCSKTRALMNKGASTTRRALCHALSSAVNILNGDKKLYW